MCGIFFFDPLVSSGTTSINRLKQLAIIETARDAFDRLAHRGPDHSGFEALSLSPQSAFDRCCCVWGCHRLSVVAPDGAASNQPIWIDGHGIVCNGQMYNFRSLSTPPPPSSPSPSPSRDLPDCNDVATLLSAFINRCMPIPDEPNVASSQSTPDTDFHDRLREFFASVDGEFACIVRTPQQHTILARDPVGVRPLFWIRDPLSGRVIAAASEVKALLPLLSLLHPDDQSESVKHREHAIGYAIEDFPPGCVYCDHGHARVTSYTEVLQAPSTHRPGTQDDSEAEHDSDAIARTLVAPLREAVIKRLTHADHDRGYVGVLLSGGLDSSLIACIAHDYLSGIGRAHDLRTYAVSFEGKGIDAHYARMLAQNLGILDQHTEVSFTLQDVSDVVHDVVYHCETSDAPTIRAGIPMFLLARHIRETSPHKAILSGEGSDEVFMGYPYFDDAPGVEEASRESARLLRNIHAFDVLRADRCMSAHNLELRVPFLDAGFLQHVRRTVPDRLLMPYRRPMADRSSTVGIEKHILRRAFKDCRPLRETGIIDRMKEKMSHGCGQDYVPALLDMVPGRDETGFYRDVFHRVFTATHMYPPSRSVRDRSWCVPRTMPLWADMASQEKMRRGKSNDWSKHAKPDPKTLTDEQLRERERRNKEDLDSKLREMMTERSAVHHK